MTTTSPACSRGSRWVVSHATNRSPPPAAAVFFDDVIVPMQRTLKIRRIEYAADNRSGNRLALPETSDPVTCLAGHLAIDALVRIDRTVANPLHSMAIARASWSLTVLSS